MYDEGKCEFLRARDRAAYIFNDNPNKGETGGGGIVGF